MVRTAYPQMGGHASVRGGRKMPGVWVAVAKAVVAVGRAPHFTRALWQVCRERPGSSCRVEKSSRSPPGCGSHGRAACTCGNTQVRRALSDQPVSKKRGTAGCAAGRVHSPLICGGEQESDAE